AEALADRALALAGGATFANDATNYHAALMTQVRQVQGRLAELVPAMVVAATIPGGFPILRYALAFAQVETGDLEGARTTFAAAAERARRPLPARPRRRRGTRNGARGRGTRHARSPGPPRAGVTRAGRLGRGHASTRHAEPRRHDRARRRRVDDSRRRRIDPP